MADIMGIYDNFFASMTHHEWEQFAALFFECLGYRIVKPPSLGQDGGADIIIANNIRTDIVSCKHYIASARSVGVTDEVSILERVIQQNANGFIGFYSTYITSSLQTRIEEIQNNFGISFEIYNNMSISYYIPQLPTSILLLFGNIKDANFLHGDEYVPLKCNYCGCDILQQKNRSYSIAHIRLDQNDILHFEFGCKNHIIDNYTLPWIEITQAMHIDQLINFINLTNLYVRKHKISQNFYESMSQFQNGINQIQIPPHLGSWL